MGWVALEDTGIFEKGYFDVFKDIQGLSETALARQNAALTAVGNTGSPFTSPVPSNDNVVGALNSMNDNLGQILTGNIAPILSAINANIGRIGNTGTVQPSNGGYQLGGNSYF